MLEFVNIDKRTVEVRLTNRIKIGTLIEFETGWEMYFKLPIPNGEELRQIADKLDELNGVKHDLPEMLKEQA